LNLSEKMDINTIPIKFKSFLIECKRVLQLTKRPTMAEFKTIVKASALGIVIIGSIGFILQMAKIVFL